MHIIPTACIDSLLVITVAINTKNVEYVTQITYLKKENVCISTINARTIYIYAYIYI